jgi:hypothetical protein
VCPLCVPLLLWWCWQLRLRPHAKMHKTVEVAARQVALGAVGICCQKASEAEVGIDRPAGERIPMDLFCLPAFDLPVVFDGLIPSSFVCSAVVTHDVLASSILFRPFPHLPVNQGRARGGRRQGSWAVAVVRTGFDPCGGLPVWLSGDGGGGHRGRAGDEPGGGHAQGP